MPRPFSIGKHFAVCCDNEKNKALFDAIRSQKYKVVCANDGFSGENYIPVKNALNAALHSILSEPSSYEKENSQ